MTTKQLLRRYSDGTMVATDETYKGFIGFQYVQLQSSTEWNIPHNKNSQKYIAQIYDSDGFMISSDIITIDSCNIQCKFSIATSGFVNIIFLDDYTETTC